MNKTAHTEHHRLFLIEKLPDPLNPASSHIQIFDNYIPNTRMRLRSMRDPTTKAWVRVLQQRFPADDGTLALTKLAEMYLNEAEYAAFERFEGREIRKNRYFHEFDLFTFSFDVYLGPLWGLTTARVDFDDVATMDDFEPPVFALYEVTNDEFFDGRNLVENSFDSVQAERARLSPLRISAANIGAE